MLASSFILFMIGLIATGALLTIAGVGKPRGLITPGLAAYVTLLSAVELAGMVYLYAQL